MRRRRSDPRPSRRDFLRRGLAAGAALSALPAPAIFARVGPLSSERFRVAHIGVGGRGTSLLDQSLGTADVDVVAVADVDAAHAGRAHARAAGKLAAATRHADHREILDRSDVDAVIIATPDHWHAVIAIDACDAGKDVYVEKPLSTTIAEGRAMVRAAREKQRVVQMGIHHRSADYIHRIVEIIRSGRIGKVTRVGTWMWANPVKPRTPPSAPPQGLDFERWLGPSPLVPYHPDRVHFNFRWCRDYAGGYMTDWGVHMMNVVTFAMDVDHKGPSEVRATGSWADDNLYDFPVTMDAEWRFEDPDFTLTWNQPGDGGDVVPGQKHGMTFYGEAGELRTYFGGHAFYRGGVEAPLPEPARTFEIPPSPGHFRDFLEAVRGRHAPVADVEIGHRTNSLCILGNIALETGRALRWDWSAERFTGDAAADALLSRDLRAPWGPRRERAST